MAFYSTKTYGNERGLSACFRQWRASHSHCSFLHGYALGFRFTFGCTHLDQNNWVVDFGSLKWLKAWLEETFDHKLVVAHDDPWIDQLIGLENGLGEPQDRLASIVKLPRVGCEAFAEEAWKFASQKVRELYGDRVWVESVECFEHGANSAIFKGRPGVA